MAKMTKMYYYTSKGEKKVNCYMIPIPRKLVEQTGLDNKEIKLSVNGNKIIMERK